MTDKGKAGKRTRYIKQDLDKKGRIKKSSRVIKDFKYWEYVEGLDKKIAHLKKHLLIRNLIICILIAIIVVLLRHTA